MYTVPSAHQNDKVSAPPNKNCNCTCLISSPLHEHPNPSKNNATSVSFDYNDFDAYEERIADSAPQKIILFACDENESATDTVDEDIQSHSQYLLDATQMILDEARESFIIVSQAHVRARGLILKNPKMQQRPKIRQPNLPIDQRLPFAVNPNFF